MPTACSGLLALRGYIGANSAPTEEARLPVWIGDRYASTMSAFQKAVADNLDNHRIGFERADHELTVRPPMALQP